MITIAHPDQTSNRATVFSAGLLWSLATLIANILPVVFQALHHSRGMSVQLLGTIGTAFMLGKGVVAASSAFWVYRVSPRRVSAAALPVTILGLLGIAFLSNAADQTYWWFAVGLATACIGAPSYTALGYAEDPLRAYSVALLVSLSIAAAASYALPLVVLPRFGDKGVLVTIAALFALGAPLVLKLSYNRPTTAAASSGHAGTRKHGVHRAGGRLAVSVPILAALAGGIFTGVISGSIYDFVGPLASAVGIGAQTVGAVLAASLIAAIAAPMLPSLLGARIPDTSMISMSTVAVLLTYPAMMSHSPTIFATGFVVHCFFGTLGYTYYLGVVRRLDFTDRVYVAYPALQLVCIAGGTALAGFVLARFAPAMLFAVSAIAIGASWFAIVAAQRLSTRFRSA